MLNEKPKIWFDEKKRRLFINFKVQVPSLRKGRQGNSERLPSVRVSESVQSPVPATRLGSGVATVLLGIM
jgi:hypothetical protein